MGSQIIYQATIRDTRHKFRHYMSWVTYVTIRNDMVRVLECNQSNGASVIAMSMPDGGDLWHSNTDRIAVTACNYNRLISGHDFIFWRHGFLLTIPKLHAGAVI